MQDVQSIYGAIAQLDRERVEAREEIARLDAAVERLRAAVLSVVNELENANIILENAGIEAITERARRALEGGES